MYHILPTEILTIPGHAGLQGKAVLSEYRMGLSSDKAYHDYRICVPVCVTSQNRIESADKAHEASLKVWIA